MLGYPSLSPGMFPHVSWKKQVMLAVGEGLAG